MRKKAPAKNVIRTTDPIKLREQIFADISNGVTPRTAVEANYCDWKAFQTSLRSDPAIRQEYNAILGQVKRAIEIKMYGDAINGTPKEKLNYVEKRWPQDWGDRAPDQITPEKFSETLLNYADAVIKHVAPDEQKQVTEEITDLALSLMAGNESSQAVEAEINRITQPEPEPPIEQSGPPTTLDDL